MRISDWSSDVCSSDLMLGHLIAYLRRSLPRNLDGQSTLGEELERAVAYLEILKIRMGSRLSTQVDVPEALYAVAFPSMMLQTLVENAIKHGLESKPGGGTVWIRATGGSREVSVTVADDGRGFNAESSGTGIGLKRSEEHTSELQSLMRSSYAVFCLQKKNRKNEHHRKQE